MADPHFASVVLLLGNDNAADGTTTFLDQSGAPHAITRVADTVYDDAQAATGMTSSILFDGTGDRLSAADSDDWYFAAGEFTIEFFVRHAATQSHRYISQWNTSTSFIVDLNVGTLRLVTSDSSGVQQNVTNAWAPTNGVWYHVAAVRDGNVGRLYVDGTQLNSAAITHTLRNSTEILEIGSLNAGGAGVFNGHMDSLRVTKGVCRYPGGTAFTIPPIPFSTSTTDPTPPAPPTAVAVPVLSGGKKRYKYKWGAPYIPRFTEKRKELEEKVEATEQKVEEVAQKIEVKERSVYKAPKTTVDVTVQVSQLQKLQTRLVVLQATLAKLNKELEEAEAAEMAEVAAIYAIYRSIH